MLLVILHGLATIDGWRAVGLSAYPVLAQQDMLSLCQFNSNLSSCSGLFLNRAGVCCQSSAYKACFARAANLSFTEIHVDAQSRTGDIMAGVGGKAGPAYVTNLQVKQL